MTLDEYKNHLLEWVERWSDIVSPTNTELASEYLLGFCNGHQKALDRLVDFVKEGKE